MNLFATLNASESKQRKIMFINIKIALFAFRHLPFIQRATTPLSLSLSEPLLSSLLTLSRPGVARRGELGHWLCRALAGVLLGDCHYHYQFDFLLFYLSTADPPSPLRHCHFTHLSRRFTAGLKLMSQYVSSPTSHVAAPSAPAPLPPPAPVLKCPSNSTCFHCRERKQHQEESARMRELGESISQIACKKL